MKRICDPSSGRLGGVVYLMGRNGQVVRTRVVPANPKSTSQRAIRASFSGASQGWDALTQNQQLAWIIAAAGHKSAPRLGMQGALTGNQFYVKINTTLTQFGQVAVDAPPVTPSIDPVAPQSLQVTNTTGTIALKLTCPTSPGENTVLLGAAPTKSGVHRVPALYVLGTCPAPAQGSAAITSLYTAKFGVPPVGSKVFIGAYVMDSGFKGPQSVFSALVPAA